MDVMYCNQYLFYLSVCLHMSETTCPDFTKHSAHVDLLTIVQCVRYLHFCV